MINVWFIRIDYSDEKTTMKKYHFVIFFNLKHNYADRKLLINVSSNIDTYIMSDIVILLC